MEEVKEQEDVEIKADQLVIKTEETSESPQITIKEADETSQEKQEDPTQVKTEQPDILVEDQCRPSESVPNVITSADVKIESKSESVELNETIDVIPDTILDDDSNIEPGELPPTLNEGLWCIFF